MFAKHKGKAPKDIMRMAAAEYNKMKGGKSTSKPKSKGKSKAKGGAIGLGNIAQAIPIATSLIGGVKDLFGSKPDPDKQTQRDYMLREYNRVNGTKFGVEGLHYNVPYGSGLKKRARKMKGGQYSAGALSAGSIEDLGKLATGFRGMGSTSMKPNLGGMTGGGSSGGAIMHSRRKMKGGSASGGGLGDILSNALPFLAFL